MIQIDPRTGAVSGIGADFHIYPEDLVYVLVVLIEAAQGAGALPAGEIDPSQFTEPKE